MSTIGGSVKIYDAASGKEAIAVKGAYLAFSPDGKQLATVLADPFGPMEQPTRVVLWDLVTGKEVRSLRGDNRCATFVRYTPDGKHLLAASLGGTVKVWDVESGKEVRQFQYQGPDFSGKDNLVTISPDGKHLACASHEDWNGQPMVRIYEIASGHEATKLIGHATWITCLAYSPDGMRIVTGSDDENVKVWDVATGQEVLTLSGHTGALTGVAFSPDGRRLVSSGGKEVRVWDGTPVEEAGRE
jgi:WD40 repeat protein